MTPITFEKELLLRFSGIVTHIAELTGSIEQPDLTKVEMLNKTLNSIEIIEKDLNRIKRDTNHKLVCIPLPDRFELFRDEIQKTTFKSFSLLPDPYPETEEEYKNYQPDSELQTAVQKIQELILDETEKRYMDLAEHGYQPWEAAEKVYENIARELEAAAGKYGVSDTASRDTIWVRLERFFETVL